jgi:hypothetical protein
MPVNHQGLVDAMTQALAPNYRLNPNLSVGVVSADVPMGVLPGPIVAIPDVHLADGENGDIFYDGSSANAARLEAVLGAVESLIAANPNLYALQLGDWFDVWRASGHDVASMDYGDIQNAAAYQNILDIDARIGLQHLIGNHDASFLNALPDARSTQPKAFRLGAWLGARVYAMHGHQTDLGPPANSSWDELAVAIATALATFVPTVTTFEAFVDRGYGTATALGQTLLHALRFQREDPGPVARVRDTRPVPTGLDPNAPYVVRESADTLTQIAFKAAGLHGAGYQPSLLIVGHSHNPCVAWSTAGGAPTLIVDGGGWVYGQATIVLAAGTRVSVMSVEPA